MRISPKCTLCAQVSLYLIYYLEVKKMSKPIFF